MLEFLSLRAATATSKAAGTAWWGRIHEHTNETPGEARAGYLSEGMADGGAGVTALVESLTRVLKQGISRTPRREVPTINSFHLATKIPRAFLITYPDAGHGFFQYAVLFARHVNDFPDNNW